MNKTTNKEGERREMPIVPLRIEYNWLSIDKLKKLPTKRLLTYYRKRVLPVVGRHLGNWCSNYGVCEDCGREACDIWAREAEEYQQQIREILNTREHIG